MNKIISLPFDRYPHIAIMEKIFQRKFPYFASIIERQFEQFGEAWLAFFEDNLHTFFGDDLVRLEKGVIGYGRFSLDAMRLQKRFDETHQYEHKTYIQTSSEVYQNKEYMFDLYLPGIFLSHFLWPHHYRQHIFFMESFLPRVKSHGGQRFYDIGVGTGFYSKEMLRCNSQMKGSGFDLSPFSFEYTMGMLKAWGFTERYRTNLQNIVTNPVKIPAPFLINVEVLEHLENPQEFLNALYQMMEHGGFGFVTAAITAPNADHIYLYNSAQEVMDQIEYSGFKVVEYINDKAYEQRHQSESVPQNGAFIVTK